MPDKMNVCSQCSADYRPAPYQTNRQKYCSLKCQRKAAYDLHRARYYPERKVICIGCGELFATKFSQKKLCTACNPNSKAGLRWATYKISQKDYDRMKEQQRGVCAICWRRPIKVIDHDHKTGKVRGLLCRACNQAIGLLFDDPEVVDRAADYIFVPREEQKHA